MKVVPNFSSFSQHCFQLLAFYYDFQNKGRCDKEKIHEFFHESRMIIDSKIGEMIRTTQKTWQQKKWGRADPTAILKILFCETLKQYKTKQKPGIRLVCGYSVWDFKQSFFYVFF